MTAAPLLKPAQNELEVYQVGGLETIHTLSLWLDSLIFCLYSVYSSENEKFTIPRFNLDVKTGGFKIKFHTFVLPQFRSPKTKLSQIIFKVSPRSICKSIR